MIKAHSSFKVYEKKSSFKSSLFEYQIPMTWQFYKNDRIQQT